MPKDAGRLGLSVRLRQAAPIPLDTEMDCGPGELVALVGPSGSGKSTILRCVAGLHRPREGKVACGAAVWLNTSGSLFLPPQKRSVGLVFQHYALFPHMTALDNVVAALSHLPRAERAPRALKLLEAVHLAGLEKRHPAELSGGQQQRVAVARALARDPAVLLLDEPFSAVDQVTRRKLQRELAQLRQSLSIPIVLVTHDLDEAAVLADRMYVIHGGRVLQCGPPFEVLSRPRTREVARLVDLRNVFDGEVLEHRPDTGLTLLRWLGHILEVRYSPEFPAGARASWIIPPANIVLHRRDRPSRGEHENPVGGTVSELVRLGETTSVLLRVDDRDDQPLSLSIPTHVATRNGLAVGVPAMVSLLSGSIHLMPWEPPDAGRHDVRTAINDAMDVWQD